MDKALADLIRISRAVGVDKALVQGGGGNTSVKTADRKYMFIKASGTALKDMSGELGWRRLRLEKVLAVVRDTSLGTFDAQKREREVIERLNACCEDTTAGNARPSVESHLHAILPRCVIHLHPMAVMSYVCAKKGRAALERIFADEKLPPLWVPYFDPGYTLGNGTAKLVDAYVRKHGRGPSVVFMEKHGLLVAAEKADDALRLVKRVISTCSQGLKPRGRGIAAPAPDAVVAAKLAIRKAFFDATGQYLNIAHFYDPDIASFLARADAKKLAASPALTPDELVYSNGAAVWLDKADAGTVAALLKRMAADGEKLPGAFLVKAIGLVAAARARTIPVIRDVIVNSLNVRSNAAQFGGPYPLDARERNFITNWEMEAFRKSLVAGKAEGDLKDRIAVVTGAGSGLGRSIAIGLARAGAQVALLDVDLPAAQETAGLIAKEIPGLPVQAVACNVTDEVAVDQAFGAVLNEWGGLDVLVNAAGVAPPFSLVDLPVAKWRVALEVNLTGYFLMARAAARILIAQGMGGSIVNLSSKSGLEASKNNTPYNATKAGEIHMARGWALELGADGIRVNSVCPGNVFEGSKIWNPDYIKAAAKKYGIKPEEVIPYYVSKTALRRDIKGQDIADSIVFLCSDRARTITGQTLVADSGQVMVR